MSRSEADEMLEQDFPLCVNFSYQKLKAIGMYANQTIDQTAKRQENQLKKVLKNTEN